MTKSRVLEKLRKGDFVRAASVSRVTDPWLSELIGRLGFDVIWLDMEHRAFGYEMIDRLSLACRATGMDLMVRILKTGYSSPMRCLEFGAAARLLLIDINRAPGATPATPMVLLLAAPIIPAHAVP